MKARGILLSDVSFAYPGNIKALDNVSLEINRGEFVAICGTNGSGKSTLTYILNGLIPQQINGKFEGTVTVDGTNTKNHGESFSAKIGMVFQNPDFSIFNLSVADEIGFGLKNLKTGNYSEKIKFALIRVGLTGFEDRDPQTLSFGQKQRVCLAAVIALETPYIVLDEPTASLDYSSSTGLYEILKKENKKGKTVIAVEHDTEFVWKYAGKVLVLYDGKIGYFGPVNELRKRKNLLLKFGVKP